MPTRRAPSAKAADELDARRPHVPDNEEPFGLGEPGRRGPDGPAELGVELIGHGAADVVGLEHRARVTHDEVEVNRAAHRPTPPQRSRRSPAGPPQ